MKKELELINYPNIKHLHTFIVNLDYRSTHFHREIEIILILDGEVTIKTKTENYILKKDSICVFNSNEPHEFRTTSNAQILCLQISPKICADYFPMIFNLTFKTFHIKKIVPKEIYNTIKSIIVEIGYHYYKRKIGYEFSCMSLFNQLFKLFLEYLPYQIYSDEEKKSNNKKGERLNRILNFIDENYMHILSLSDIAQREDLSESYLSHFIKDNLNQTFREYVNNLRFNQAIKLLTTTDMKLIDICAESGYSDNRYLNATFQEKFNCTPNEFRKKHSSSKFENYNTHENQKTPATSESFYSLEKTMEILEDLRDEVSAKELFSL